MTIYLINPMIIEDYSISRIGRCVTKAKADYLYPPTELLYVASYLRKYGYDVKAIDGALVKSPNQLFSKIKNPGYFITMVGIFSYKMDSNFIKMLKEKFPKVPVIVFGQGASFITEDYLNVADYVVFGEPEKPILEIIQNKEEVIGVSYKKKGRVILNKKPNLLKNLDELPYPARDLINNSIYKHAFMKPYAMVYSSRGCPYNCIFCTSKGYSPFYRIRSVENIINELKEIYYKYKIKNFGFIDETFTLNKNRIIAICKGLVESGLNMDWIALGRVDKVDEEILRWMKKAGCKIIMYGIESSDQKVLDFLKKDMKVDQIKKAIDLTRKCGIETHGFFIFGSPLDTKQTIVKTIKFAKKLKLDYASFNIFVPYPGTESFMMLEKENQIKTRDWSKYDQSLNELVYRHKFFKNKDIQKLIKKAYREFYLNPQFIIRRFLKDIKNPASLIRDISNVKKIFKNYL